MHEKYISLAATVYLLLIDVWIWSTRARRWWQLFLMVPVFYSAWASPFELAFPRAASGSLLAVDVFFGADIAVSFFVAYFNSPTFLLVDDRRKIAKR